MKRKTNYQFYYDESFHDRKITSSNGELNIEQNHLSDSFVDVFIGFKSFQHNYFQRAFSDYENECKNIFGLKKDQELKTSTINKKNFKYGISSFNNNTLIMYTKFFELIEKDILIHVDVFSKFELVIFQILKDTSFPLWVEKEAFTYSLIKILNQYKNKDLIKVLFDFDGTDKDLLYEIKKLLNEILAYIENVQRKQRETIAVKQLIYIIDKIKFSQTKNCYEWNYFQSFNGFNLFLEEKNIAQRMVYLTIDEEEKTYLAARNYKYKNIESGKSHEILLLRFADLLCGFIGRFLYSIETENIEDWDLPSTKESINDRRIISKNWFELSTQKFKLYKTISLLFKNRSDEYWLGHTGIYFDSSIQFFSLIHYIGDNYRTFEEFNKITSDIHRERYNSYTLANIEQQYRKF